jgi:hypothetical protein
LSFEKEKMKQIRGLINEERNKGGYEDRESGRNSGRRLARLADLTASFTSCGSTPNYSCAVQ